MKNKVYFERLNKNNYGEVRRWFDLPYFYFDTHEPDKIPGDRINFILNFPNSYWLVVKVKEKSIGLIDYTFGGQMHYVTYEVAFSTPDGWEKLGEIVLKKFLKSLFLNYPITRAEKWVYSFDLEAKRCMRKINVKKEGKIRSIIFKNGKFHDIIIFTAYKENWI